MEIGKDWFNLISFLLKKNISYVDIGMKNQEFLHLNK